MPEGEEKKEQKKYLKQEQNFPQMLDIKSQIQEAQRTPSKRNVSEKLQLSIYFQIIGSGGGAVGGIEGDFKLILKP